MDDELEKLLILCIAFILGILIATAQPNQCNEKCNNLPAHNVSTGEIIR